MREHKQTPAGSPAGYLPGRVNGETMGRDEILPGTLALLILRT